MWDAFISHASEDKSDFVRPLAELLAGYGLAIWYDELSLTIGDSLSRSIDKGLAESRFGIVVLSPAFISKNWPEYELRGLTAREMHTGKIILPVWHNITKDQVLQFSPPLADKFAVTSSGREVRQVAFDLIKIVRPDIFCQIHRKLQWEEQLRNAKTVSVDTQEVKFGPIVHETLPQELVGRIRLLRAALWGAHTHSMKVWVDGFRRDLHPETEIAWWEHVAACYLEFIKTRKLTAKQMQAAFSVVFFTSNGEKPEALSQYRSFFKAADWDLLLRLPLYREPVLDVKEEFPETGIRLSEAAYRQFRVLQIDDIPPNSGEA